MPAPAQALASGLPLTHFLRICRRIILQGAGAPDVRAELSALAVIVSCLLAVAMLRFRKKLI